MHFQRPCIQRRILAFEKQIKEKQRHRKVKGMSKGKGTFQMNMQKVLAQEEKERKLKLGKDKYSQIGRVNYERVFTLRPSYPHTQHKGNKCN